jgi:hypothetical protein
MPVEKTPWWQLIEALAAVEIAQIVLWAIGALAIEREQPSPRKYEGYKCIDCIDITMQIFSQCIKLATKVPDIGFI